MILHVIAMVRHHRCAKKVPKGYGSIAALRLVVMVREPGWSVEGAIGPDF